MSDQQRRDDGTQNGPGEQVRAKQDKKTRDRRSLGSGRVGGRPTEDDLAKRGAAGGAADDGGGK